MTKLGSDIAGSPARLVDASEARRSSCQFPSGDSDRLRDVLALAPLRQQGPPAPGVALAGRRGADDAIGAEMAEILPRLAPGDDHPRRIEEGKGEGPDCPLAAPPAGIFIEDPQLALRPHPAPELAK